MERKISFDFSLKSIFSITFTIIIVALLFYVRDILVLLLISFILATAFEPLVDWLEKKRVPRIITVVLIYFIIALVFYTLIRLMIPPITAQFNQLLANRQVIFDRFSNYFTHLPVEVRNSLQTGIDKMPERVANFFSNSLIPNVLGVFSGLLGVLTVLVSSFYILLEKNSVENAIKSYWPVGSEKKALAVYKKIVQKISLWARGQLIQSTAVGVLVYIGLVILHFDYALLLALTAAVIDIFPIIGPTIMIVLGFLLAIATSPLQALWVVLLLVGVQQFEGNVLSPQIMKRAVGLPPVLIIFSLLIGAKLLGFVGIIIAVPLASAILVILEAFHKKEIE